MTLLLPFVSALVVALAVLGAAWAVSSGRLHRSDRIGAAAIAVGFVVGYQWVTGGGWHPERPVTSLPMVAVFGALLLPRLAGRVASAAPVRGAARLFVLVAAAGAAAALVATGRPEAGTLELAVLGAALGSVAGERLAAGEAGTERSSEAGAHGGPSDRADRRVGTWLLAALLVGVIPVLAA